MRILSISILMFVFTLFTQQFSASNLVFAQQEEMMEEGTQKKKEEPKKEVKKEEQKSEQKTEQKAEKKAVESKSEEILEPETKSGSGSNVDEDGGNLELPLYLRFYKEKYEYRFAKPFEIVWNAVKKSLEDIGCMIALENYKATDEGLYKGNIKSDFCVFSAGKDTTFKTLNKYSYDLPVIRGGIWLNGRMQYTVVVKEESNGQVYMLIKGELSGFEDFVTHEVHFWKSNGIFETRLSKLIERNFDAVMKK